MSNHLRLGLDYLTLACKVAEEKEEMSVIAEKLLSMGIDVTTFVTVREDGSGGQLSLEMEPTEQPPIEETSTEPEKRKRLSAGEPYSIMKRWVEGMKLHGATFTTLEAREACGFPSSTASNQLQSLARVNIVDNIGVGLWRRCHG